MAHHVNRITLVYSIYSVTYRNYMNLMDKLSNPFLKPSPFTKQQPLMTNDLISTPFSRNIYESSVSPFPITSNNGIPTPSPSTANNEFAQMKPTHDYDYVSNGNNFIANNDIESLLSKSPFQKSNFMNVGSVDGYKNFREGRTDPSISPKLNNEYRQGYTPSPSTNYLNTNYNSTDNRSDTGSNYTYINKIYDCLLYTSPSPRDKRQSRMPSSA